MTKKSDKPVFGKELERQEEFLRRRLADLDKSGKHESNEINLHEIEKKLKEPILDSHRLRARFASKYGKAHAPTMPLEHSEEVSLPATDMNLLEPSGSDSSSDRANMNDVKICSEKINKLKVEVSKILIGQEGVFNSLMKGLICNGHVLIEGVPGLAKTLIVRSLGEATGCEVKRVQFTVDLLPTDITGISSYTPGKGFDIIKGPVFSNFLIADEINRSPPKTQSALMEAMQEKQVTIGRENLKLPNPFFVMATENPLENAGVYPLPEAQIDRFLLKIIVGYPKKEEEKRIMENNMTLSKFEEFEIKSVISPKDILDMQRIVKKIYIDDRIKDYILDIIEKTRTRNFKGGEYLSYGASPRATIAIYIVSKANALMNGRTFVLPEDVRDVVYEVLRHRLILSYKATLENIKSDDLIRNIIDEIEVK